MAAKIRRDDEVIVIAGKDKNKTGKVELVFVKEHKVIVKGINLVKKHQNFEVAMAIECFYKSAELGREVRVEGLK